MGKKRRKKVQYVKSINHNEEKWARDLTYTFLGPVLREIFFKFLAYVEALITLYSTTIDANLLLFILRDFGVD